MFWKKKRLHFWTLIVFFLILWKLLLRLWLGHFADGRSELILLLMWFSSPTSSSSSSPSNRSRGLTALLYRGHIRHQALESTGEAHAGHWQQIPFHPSTVTASWRVEHTKAPPLEQIVRDRYRGGGRRGLEAACSLSWWELRLLTEMFSSFFKF